MKIDLYTWQKYLIVFILGMLVGWGITAYSNMPKTSGNAMCPDGSKADKNGCCAGEIYTDMGDLDNHLIKCDPYLGFTIYEFEKCIDFFKKK